MQKVKILFIGCLLSATLNAQTVNNEPMALGWEVIGAEWV